MIAPNIITDTQSQLLRSVPHLTRLSALLSNGAHIAPIEEHYNFDSVSPCSRPIRRPA